MDPITDAIDYARKHPLLVAGAAYLLGCSRHPLYLASEIHDLDVALEWYGERSEAERWWLCRGWVPATVVA